MPPVTGSISGGVAAETAEGTSALRGPSRATLSAPILASASCIAGEYPLAQLRGETHEKGFPLMLRRRLVASSKRILWRPSLGW
jgi:hypothetical protein